MTEEWKKCVGDFREAMGHSVAIADEYIEAEDWIHAMAALCVVQGNAEWAAEAAGRLAFGRFKDASAVDKVRVAAQTKLAVADIQELWDARGYANPVDAIKVIKHALPIILGDLADLGFDAEWTVLSAGEVGATHKRERFWLLAYPRGQGGSTLARSSHGDEAADEGRAEGHGHEFDGTGEDVGHTNVAGLEGRGVRGCERADERTAWPSSSPFPPPPDDHAAWQLLLAHSPSLEPALRRDADGMAHRMDRLRVIGNGVVPLVAAVAFVGLAERAGIWEGLSDG